jgi:hypothetical protein
MANTGRLRQQHPADHPYLQGRDRPSADIVVELLETHSVPCLRRGTCDTMHIGLGPQNFSRVDVRPSDEARA